MTYLTALKTARKAVPPPSPYGRGWMISGPYSWSEPYGISEERVYPTYSSAIRARRQEIVGGALILCGVDPDVAEAALMRAENERITTIGGLAKRAAEIAGVAP